jgi:hypothetical protein
MKLTEEKWNIYVAVLVYPASLTPEEYADLCARHLEWCLQNGIHQLLHACYKMNATKDEVEAFVSSIVSKAGERNIL